MDDSFDLPATPELASPLRSSGLALRTLDSNVLLNKQTCGNGVKKSGCSAASPTLAALQVARSEAQSAADRGDKARYSAIMSSFSQLSLSSSAKKGTVSKSDRFITARENKRGSDRPLSAAASAKEATTGQPEPTLPLNSYQSRRIESQSGSQSNISDRVRTALPASVSPKLRINTPTKKRNALLIAAVCERQRRKRGTELDSARRQSVGSSGSTKIDHHRCSLSGSTDSTPTPRGSNSNNKLSARAYLATATAGVPRTASSQLTPARERRITTLQTNYADADDCLTPTLERLNISPPNTVHINPSYKESRRSRFLASTPSDATGPAPSLASFHLTNTPNVSVLAEDSPGGTPTWDSVFSANSPPRTPYLMQRAASFGATTPANAVSSAALDESQRSASQSQFSPSACKTHDAQFCSGDDGGECMTPTMDSPPTTTFVLPPRSTLNGLYGASQKGIVQSDVAGRSQSKTQPTVGSPAPGTPTLTSPPLTCELTDPISRIPRSVQHARQQRSDLDNNIFESTLASTQDAVACNPGDAIRAHSPDFPQEEDEEEENRVVLTKFVPSSAKPQWLAESSLVAGSGQTSRAESVLVRSQLLIERSAARRGARSRRGAGVTPGVHSARQSARKPAVSRTANADVQDQFQSEFFVSGDKFNFDSPGSVRSGHSTPDSAGIQQFVDSLVFGAESPASSPNDDEATGDAAAYGSPEWLNLGGLRAIADVEDQIENDDDDDGTVYVPPSMRR